MEKTEHPILKELKYTLYRIFRNPTAIIGFGMLSIFIAVAILAPVLAPPKNANKPYKMPRAGYSSVPKPPSEKAIWGTTSGQYDIYYGAVWGTRTAFKVGLSVVTIALLIGCTIGVIAGYYGGIVDEIIMRIVDIFYAIPFLVLAMTVVVAFGRGLDIIILAIASVAWRSYVRVMRASILTIRDMEYVQAAKVMGVSDFMIMIRHVLPNSIFPVMVVAFMEVGAYMLTAAFMAFIGLGASKGYADWGQMVALARNYIVGPATDPLRYWFTIAIPGGLIVLFVLAWNLIGDAMRDAFDPKLRG